MIRLTKAQWDEIFFQKCNADGFPDFYPGRAYTLEEYAIGLKGCSHRGSDKYISIALCASLDPAFVDMTGQRLVDILKDVKRKGT